MMAIVLVLLAVIAFLGGFLCGILYTPRKTATESKKCECGSISFSKEYENFLNYDGSEQI